MTNGISKGITKQNIVNVTLNLIKDIENIRTVNLREIGRVLGKLGSGLQDIYVAKNKGNRLQLYKTTHFTDKKTPDRMKKLWRKQNVSR